VQRPFCLDNPELMGKPSKVDKRKVLQQEVQLAGGHVDEQNDVFGY